MASLSQVTLELKVTGERQATKALKDFADAGNKVGTSVGELGRKLSSIEGEYKRINDLNKQGVITDDARRGAISKLVVQLRQLTGITGDQARAALEGAQAAKDKSEADKRAAQAAEQHARAQKNLEGSILRQAQAVNQAVRRMDELKRLQASGAVGSRDMAQAELEVARALARTNGYLKANGALNTQKALAELRAAQATRESAAAEAAANAERQRAQQGYNRLMASINPVIARQQDMRRAHETVMAALKAEIITRDQAAQALREYRTAQQSSNMASSVAATQYIPQVRRQTNQLGVVFQQAGYQVGDFAVQVQSGTNVMVALGQQLTQLVGVGAMLARSTKWIAAFSALGIIVPITTAIVGGFMRANGEAKKFKDTLDELETSVSSYKSSMEEASASTTELNARFGDVSDSMRPFLQDLVELERITAVNRLQQSFENLEVSQQGFMDTIRSGLLGSAEAVRQIRERLDLTSQEYVDFYEKLRVLQEAESFGDRAAAAKELSEFIKDTAGSVENMTPDMREFYQQLVQAVLAGGELNGVIDRGNESLRERATIESTIANIQREVNSGVQQILDFKEQETQQLQNQLALQLIANEYGEDSAEYARLKRQQEEEAYRTYLSQNDILGNNADEIIRTWRALQNANDAAEAFESRVRGAAEAAREARAAYDERGILGIVNRATAALD